MCRLFFLFRASSADGPGARGGRKGKCVRGGDLPQWKRLPKQEHLREYSTFCSCLATRRFSSACIVGHLVARSLCRCGTSPQVSLRRHEWNVPPRCSTGKRCRMNQCDLTCAVTRHFHLFTSIASPRSTRRPCFTGETKPHTVCSLHLGKPGNATL